MPSRLHLSSKVLAQLIMLCLSPALDACSRLVLMSSRLTLLDARTWVTAHSARIEAKHQIEYCQMRTGKSILRGGKVAESSKVTLQAATCAND